MAKNNFNFRATLKLESKEFKRGVRDIQRSLNGLKTAFMNFAGAMGVSLGFSKIISGMKETAVALDTAKNILKNVSTTTVEYAESLEFLRKISNEYGQDLISLINNFGQFRAAAATSGLEIDELRSIYESLTRAAGAYHMSADRTRDMMNAVTQMFSKGKVAAEELRRQLGNSLPGAFNLMAKAAYMAGITTSDSTAELEDMMRKGKILASDVMPAFAKVLDEVTAKANFNSLQQSINRLRNTWTEFVEKSGATGGYEKLLDGLNRGLVFLTKNVNILKAALFGGGTGLLLTSIWKKNSRAVADWKTNVAASMEQVEKNISSTRRALVQAFKKIGIEYYAPEGTPEAAEQLKTIENLPVDEYRKLVKATIDYNNAEIKQIELKRTISFLNRKEIAKLQRLRKENIALAQEMVNGSQKAVLSMNTVGATLTRIGVSIKNFFVSNIWTLAIAALTTIVGLMIQWRRQAKEIAGYHDRINETIANADVESDAVKKLESYKLILQNIESGSTAWKKVMGELKKIMGENHKILENDESTLDDIIGAIDKWEDGLRGVNKEWAIMAALEQNAADKIKNDAEKIALLGDEKNYRKAGPNPIDDTKVLKGFTFGKNSTWGWGPKQQYNVLVKTGEEIVKTGNELAKQYQGQVDENKNKQTPPPPPPPEPTGETRLDKVQKIVDDYEDKLNKLNNQFKEGAITAGELKKSTDDLVNSTFKELAGFGDLGTFLKGFSPAKVKNLTNFKDALKKLYDDLVVGELEKLDEAADDANDKEQQEIGKKLLEEAKDNLTKGMEVNDIYKGLPTGPDKRDTSFDYKKGQEEILAEDAENMDNFREKLEDAVNKLAKLGQVGTEQFGLLFVAFKQAEKEAKNLQDAAKVAQWKADIKELSDEYKDKLYSSVRDVASSVERLYNVYKDFAEVFGAEIDPDGNFQKILTIFGALFETFETIYTVVKSLNELSAAQAALEKAKNNAQMKALEQEIGLQAALGAAKVTASEAATAAAVGEAAAVKTLAEVSKEAAAAAAVANAMAVPYPANLAALASNMAAATSAYAMMRGLTAFAKGGIVGGNSTSGDKNIIRANSGEMILTKAQQGTLFEMLNGKKGVSGQVDFRIKGTDLVGTLNNYNQKRKG